MCQLLIELCEKSKSKEQIEVIKSAVTSYNGILSRSFLSALVLRVVWVTNNLELNVFCGSRFLCLL